LAKIGKNWKKINQNLRKMIDELEINPKMMKIRSKSYIDLLLDEDGSKVRMNGRNGWG
jgi:hypothetical protein